MHRYLSCFVILFSLILLASCKRHSNYAATLFDQVETLVEQYPDSALALLDSIPNPYELNDEQFARYLLCSLQAKTKAGKDISSDMLIFRVRDYYQKKNQQKKRVMAEFYCGRVLQSQGKQEEAVQAFLETRELADKIKDVYWSGMADFYIGYLNYKQYLCKEARPYFKSACQKMSTIKGKYKNEIIACSYISKSFLLDKPQALDSALFYERKSLEIAKQYNNLTEQIEVNQSIGVILLEEGDTRLSKEITLYALALSKQANDSNRLPEIYGNLADVYQKENKIDSAMYYAELALMSTDDNDYKSTLYGTLSDIEASRGNYQKALEYLNVYADYADSLYNQKQSQNVLEIQKKYNFELIQNANRKLANERLWLFIAFILLAVSSFLVYFINRAKNKEALLQSKQHVYQLKEMVVEKANEGSRNMEKNKELKSILFRQLDILKKISLLEVYLGKEEKKTGQTVLKKVNGIIYDSNENFDWTIFYQSVNVLYDDFLARLATQYPSLTPDEVLVCCLSKIEFTNDEIALLMKANTNIIQKKRSSIREKTGMKKQESFVKQLDEVVRMG